MSLIDRLNGVSEQVALKRPVRVATTANITLSGFQTIDGVTPVDTDSNLRILVKNQSTQTENGIYTMATGSWERTADFDGNRDVIKGTRVPVVEGTVNANKTYIVTTSDPVVIESSNIAFSEITESIVTAEFAKTRSPTVSISTDTTLTASAHAGKMIEVDCSSADVTVTLPACSSMTDGDRITIRFATGTNQVIIDCAGSDAINGATSIALGQRYESLTLATSGTDWSVVGTARPFTIGSLTMFDVVNRTLTTPPISPVPGSRYIIAASGTTTGDWVSFSNNDVVEANGVGGWVRYAPSEGWHAYIDAENKLAFYTGSAWQGLPNTDDPGASVLGYAVFQDQRSNGTVGGGITQNAWTSRPLQTTIANTITGCSLASNTITLPAGTYLIVAEGTFWKTGWTQLRLKSTTSSTAVTGPSIISVQTGTAFTAHATGILSLSGAESFKLEYFCESNSSTSDLGAPLTSQTEAEVYANVQIIDLSSLQGPQGDPGDQGPQGFAGLKYQFSTTTTQADPGAGVVRLNNAALESVTAAVIDATSNETGNPDVSDEIAAWNAGGVLKLAKVGAEQNFATYTVQGVTDNGGYLALVLVYRDHAGSFGNGDAISVQFAPAGAAGAVGATGSNIPVFDYEYNSTTAGDPGSGKILFDNATFASATSISVNDTDRVGVDRSADIATWDDLGETSGRGTLYVLNATTGARLGAFTVTGTVTDNTTYQTYSVSYISGTAPANNTRVALAFFANGQDGANGVGSGTIEGGVGASDNVVPRADGTGGVTLQAGLFTNDDSGNIFPNTTDTGALGTATNSWADLFLASGGVVNWNNGDATITHAANELTFGGASSGYKFDAAVTPSASDGAALGSASLMWSDAFLASGGVLNWNNGDVTITHAANKLTVAGADDGVFLNTTTSKGVGIGTTTVNHAAWGTPFDNVVTIHGPTERAVLEFATSQSDDVGDTIGAIIFTNNNNTGTGAAKMSFLVQCNSRNYSGGGPGDRSSDLTFQTWNPDTDSYVQAFTIGSPDSVSTVLIDTEGPHGINTDQNLDVLLYIGGNQTRATGATFGASEICRMSTNASVPVNMDGRGLVVSPTFAEAASGTHSMMSSILVAPPNITSGAAATTNAASLYVTGAPTGATTNYALWVDAGVSRFDGNLNLNSAAQIINMVDPSNAQDAATKAYVDTKDLLGQNSQSAAYTTVLSDGGKHIYHPSSDNNARTFTIDSNANVAYPIGTTITFVNEINTVTIAITSDTLVLAGAGTTGSRTLAANGIATALKVGTTRWVISGTGLT